MRSGQGSNADLKVGRRVGYHCTTTNPENRLKLPAKSSLHIFIYLFGVLHRFQHCTGHITTGRWKVRGNQYIQFVRVLYCKLPTNGKQPPAFPLETVPGTEPRPQRWEARVCPVAPLCILGWLHVTHKIA